MGVLTERVNAALKSNSEACLINEYSVLEKALFNRAKMLKSEIVNRVCSGILQRNIAAENYVPGFFKQKKNIIALR